VFRGVRENFQEIALLPFLREFVDRLDREGRRKIRLKTNDLNPVIKTDALALRACISELLTNADKYSTAGKGIDLELKQPNGGVTLEVRNRGPRLSSAELKRIRQYGFRGISAITSGQPGSGGGLSLVTDTLDDLGLKFGYAVQADPKARSGDSSAEHVVSVIVPTKCLVSLN
jgi:signal transduction histidine kinase